MEQRRRRFWIERLSIKRGSSGEPEKCLSQFFEKNRTQFFEKNIQQDWVSQKNIKGYLKVNWEPETPEDGIEEEEAGGFGGGFFSKKFIIRPENKIKKESERKRKKKGRNVELAEGLDQP